MAQFRVSGADRESGDELEITVDASSVRDATEKARKLGMLISDCTLIDGVAAPVVHSPPPVQPRVTLPPTPKSWWHIAVVEQARTTNSVGLLVTIIVTVGLIGLFFAVGGISILLSMKKPGPEAFPPSC